MLNSLEISFKCC